MKKSEYIFILNSIRMAQSALFEEDINDVGITLKVIETFCQAEIDEIREREGNER